MTYSFTTLPLEECMEQLIDYRGKTPRKTEAGIPLITAKVIKNGKILPPTEFIAESDYESWMRRGIPKEGDVVLTVEAPLGEVAQLDSRKIALAQRVITLRGKKDLLNNTFLKYLLMSNECQSHLNGRASGTTVIGIKQSELRKVLLTFPPLSIQNKISNILSTLDDKIELNKKINHTLESIAQAMFKSWFVDFDPVHAKANANSEDEYDAIAKELGISREILDLFPSEFEENEMGLIPKGWGFNNLSDFISVVKGKSYKSSELQPSSTALVTLKSFLRGGGYRLDGLKQYIGKYKNEQIVEPGELIIAYTDVTQNADVIGKPAIVIHDKNIETLVASLDVGIVRIIKEHFPLSYLFYYFKTELFQNYILGYTSGTTVLHLSKNWIENHNILTPPQKMIRQFDGFCRNVFHQLNENIQEVQILEDIKTLLLPKLISGEIDVSNLKLEPEND